VISIFLSFRTTKANYKKLQEKTFFETKVKVYRKYVNAHGPILINSGELVPGDVIEVPQNQRMPCDMILIKGICIMNESMLTGESVPVIKEPLPNNDSVFDRDTHRKYILYSGTTCLETRTHNQEPILAIVFGTGFSTIKGQLIRSMLYPKPENFKFYRDAMKFITVMVGLALIGRVFFLFFNNVSICFCGKTVDKKWS